jgi:hypothetical protein
MEYWCPIFICLLKGGKYPFQMSDALLQLKAPWIHPEILERSKKVPP